MTTIRPLRDGTRPRRQVLSVVLSTIILACWLAAALVTVTSLYTLVTGHRLHARVVSCGYKTCEVTWHEGTTTHTSVVETFGTPGATVTLLQQPGGGAVGEHSTVAAMLVCLAFTAGLPLLVLTARRRRRRTQPTASRWQRRRRRTLGRVT